MSERSAFPENVPGDFYVEDGCCLSCGMPTTVAPDLFDYAEEGHCFVKFQPRTASDHMRMISAILVADTGCIRYKGQDRTVQSQLINAYEGDQCDGLSTELQLENRRLHERGVDSRHLPAGALAEIEKMVIRRSADLKLSEVELAARKRLLSNLETMGLNDEVVVVQRPCVVEHTSLRTGEALGEIPRKAR